jgi:hypothetical protein
MSSSPDLDEESHTLNVFATYTSFSTTTAKDKSGKPKTSKEKVDKKKDFEHALSPSEDQYQIFLKALLNECGLAKYDAVEKKPFPFQCSMTAA